MRRIALLAVMLLCFGSLSARGEDSSVTGGVGGNGDASISANKPGTGSGTGGGGVTCTYTAYGNLPDRPSQPGGATSFVRPDGSGWVVGAVNCSNGYTGGAFCYVNCPTGTPVLRPPTAEDAIALLHFPLPAARFSPPLDAVRGSNIGGYLPGMYVFVSAEAASWVPVDAVAAVGPWWIIVTATPKAVRFTVDGTAHVCEGRGPVVATDAQYQEHKGGGCSHLFTENGEHPSSVAIVYAITYQANFAVAPDNATSGTRPDRLGPATDYSLPVHEVQAVNN